MLFESRMFIGLGLVYVCYGKVGCSFDLFFCLCIIGKSVVYSTTSSCCVIWASWLPIRLDVMSVCYRKVGCLFDQICCLYVMGRSVAHLIGFTACML